MPLDEGTISATLADESNPADRVVERDELRRALRVLSPHHLAGRAPHDPDLATTIQRRVRRRRAAVSIAFAGASVVAVVAVVSLVVLGLGRTDKAAGPPADSPQQSRRAHRWTPSRYRAGR